MESDGMMKKEKQYEKSDWHISLSALCPQNNFDIIILMVNDTDYAIPKAKYVNLIFHTVLLFSFFFFLFFFFFVIYIVFVVFISKDYLGFGDDSKNIT